MSAIVKISPRALSVLDPKGKCNVKNTVVIVLEVSSRVQRTYLIDPRSKNSMRRINVIVAYLERFWTRDEATFRANLSGKYVFLFQGDDRPVDIPSLSWQTKVDYSDVCLVPDFYYEQHSGYEDFLKSGVQDWFSRKKVCIWRGATTGAFGLTLAVVKELPRYRLCQEGVYLKHSSDFAFYTVAQTARESDKTEIEAHLRSKGMLKPPIALETYSHYRMFVQIDGNGNSWELMKKLRLGCCMLLVESDWRLWDNKDLIAWTHYVPVSRDLGDLNEKVQWCLSHESAAEEIATRGREFAVCSSFANAMSAAAQATVAFLAKQEGTEARPNQQAV